MRLASGFQDRGSDGPNHRWNIKNFYRKRLLCFLGIGTHIYEWDKPIYGSQRCVLCGHFEEINP